MPRTTIQGKKSRWRRLLWRLVRWGLLAVFCAYAMAALVLLALRWIDPPTTGVQAQRRVESWFTKGKYRKHYAPVPIQRISIQLQRAVIAAEDGRFYKHHGIDWVEVGNVVEDSIEEGKVERGASTITQQLVKNIFFTTHRFAPRKIPELTLAPLAELILSKERILELYLNVIEWGPGVFGAEAAAEYHYHTTAAHLSRDQAARLAAIIPSPRKRKPARMDRYSGIIETRKRQMGW